MAIYNEILVGRYARMLQKLFGIKGEVPAKQLAGEVMPTFHLFSGSENRYLESWDLFAIVNSFAAGGVGNFNQFQLRNPAASNVIAVITKIKAGGNLTDIGTVTYGATTADLTNLNSMANTRWDPRGRSAPTCVASNAAAAIVQLPGFLENIHYQSGADGQGLLMESHEFPLLPGQAIRFNANIANQAADYTFFWRERFLEESERT
jgi:hypothetical protein